MVSFYLGNFLYMAEQYVIFSACDDEGTIL